jgi:hypothetical protein
MAGLILKRASASRPSGEWSEDDYDVLADGVVVGRIFMPEVARSIKYPVRPSSISSASARASSRCRISWPRLSASSIMV